ncbi:MAG TPA: ComEC/Rec2 family competence protein [Nocardioidaceae bacterium]|nr:ComEC/Rec2 family competence protein [Nocardioidaceae bacterium]
MTGVIDTSDRACLDASRGPPERSAPDARLAAPAVAAWVTGALALGLSPARAIGVGVMLLAIGLLALRRWNRRLGALVLAAAAASLAAGLRLTAADAGPVPDLAAEGAVVDATVTLTSDPVVREGPFGSVVVAEGRITTVTGRGATTRVRSPVVIFGDDEWMDVPLGGEVRAVGRLDASDDDRYAAVLVPSRMVEVVDDPAWWWRLSGHLRDGIAEGVATTPSDERALVPALVDGDDRAISDELAEAFRACGMTHLLAVSGTNLTLVLAFVLTLARWAGVRGYAQIAVGVAVTLGFIVLARPDPSVLRSAAMGVVAVAGLGAGGRRRGLRALAIAVIVLVVVDPWLARSAGFILSVLATGGILLLAPRWTRELSTWLPRPMAEAIAVPLAAQIVCTPVVAAISGQVSLVAVAANMVAAPAVGPATVLGLIAGLVALVWDGLAHVVGWGAAAMAWWIITVAERGASLPGAATDWSTGTWSLIVLIALCVGIVVAVPWLLRYRVGVAIGVILVAAWVVQPFSPGWPPAGWVMGACDVGQGDALVLNAGEGSAVVVDTGPEPALVDRCLDDLDIDTVALLVLTHPHADHIDGVSGVNLGRPVGSLAVAPGALDDPAYADVAAWAESSDVAVRELPYGSTGSVGDLTWRVLGPPPSAVDDAGGDEAVNDASVVLAVRTSGVSLLLTGDVEAPAQAALLRWGDRALRADVLKVPHHGSADQDPDFLCAVGPRLAIVSVGADNDYGHPVPSTLDVLSDVGATVARTDQSGEIAVVVRDGDLTLMTR